MGVRLTGISTPVGGVSWEYTKGAERSAPLSIFPRQKIKVFISSICGVEKYDKVRDELKTAIERTQLADVYTFESKEASTLPAGNHYTWALEDSDICIFLIDNTDGIKPGVQAEIDTVKKHNIKALYYFCDETQKEKTALEQSLMGAHFAKSKTVHHFSELSQDGAQALIDDIVAIYHYYCTGKIVLNSGENDEIQAVDVVGTEKYQLPTIPKSTLKNVDKCRDYFLKFVLGYSRGRYPDETENTSEFDDWGIQFLPILFEGKSIKHFNTAMYLDALKVQQDNGHYQVVQIRWQAIQAYFAGNIEKCVEYLESALSLAKETNQPTWVIKDILVDLRNQSLTRCIIRNEYSDIPAQKELTESSKELYYPILDRIHESLHEKYIEGLYALPDKQCALQRGHGFFLFLLGCFCVYIHCGGNIRMTHDFLNDLQVGFVLAEASAECVPQDMAAKLWQKNRVTIFFLRLGFFFLIIVCTNRADSAVDGIVRGILLK